MEFEITCSDEKYLKEVIEWYNRNYNTDFKIIEVVDEVEVLFVTISANQFKQSDVFELGYQFGTKEEKLRSEGKIDW